MYKQSSTLEKNQEIERLKDLNQSIYEKIAEQAGKLQDPECVNKIALEVSLKLLNEDYKENFEKIKKLSEKDNIFPPLSFADLLALPPKKWAVNQVFGKGDLGVFYGPPGCGKTFVVIDLIMCLCMGSIWAKRFDIHNPLNVAYCAGEGLSAMPSRFLAAAEHHLVQSLPNFTFFKNIPQLYGETESEVATISRFIEEWKKRQMGGDVEPLDVLIIDTLHTASEAADENSSKDMGLVIKSCKQAAFDLQCAVILVHHTTKDGLTERGSSSLRGAMDFMIRIEKIGKEGETKAKIICSKLKDGEMWMSQGFHLEKLDGHESVYVQWDDPLQEGFTGNAKHDDKRRLWSQMKTTGTRLTAKSLAESIGQASNYTTELLSEMVDEGMCNKELDKPEKKSSSRNPWVYFIESD